MRWRSKRNSVSQEKIGAGKSSIRHNVGDGRPLNAQDQTQLKNIEEESNQTNVTTSVFKSKHYQSSGSNSSLVTSSTQQDIQSFYKTNKGKESITSLESNIVSTAHTSDLTVSASTTSLNSAVQSVGGHNISLPLLNSPSLNTLTTANDDLQTTQVVSSLSSLKVGSPSSKPFNRETYDSTIIKTGWLNKGVNIGNWNSAGSDSWRIYKAQLKGPILSLYKIPPELNIKAFDNSIDPTSEPPPATNNDSNQNNTNSNSSSSVRQKRLSTSSSRLNLRQDAKTSSKDTQSPVTPSTPLTKNFRIKLRYLSENYPHPDLQLNASNSIVSGTLESICHTIVFNTLGDDKLSQNLLMILPLFGDIKAALRYFIEFGLSFSSHRSRSSNSNKVFVSPSTYHVITQRLGLVVTTIIDSFPGMLLDDDLLELTYKLVETLATHHEEFSESLKEKIKTKETEMKKLTSYRDMAYNPYGSMNLTNVDNFLKLDSQFLAQQINLIDLKFSNSWNPKTDASLLYDLENVSYSKYNPLIFNPISNIHYLGRLLVNHLFGESQTTRSESRRASVLSKWIELGSFFDKIGDMVSWLAIATVVCSVPILRLRKTWSLVNDKSLKIISTEWAPVVFELDRRAMISEASHKSSYHVIAPQGIGITYSKYDVVPYFGDLTVKYIENSSLKQCEKRVQRVKVSFGRWDEYLSNVVQNDDEINAQPKIAHPDVIRQIYNLMSNHVSLPPMNQESVMELSLSIEPNSIGEYHQYHYNSRTPLVTGSYLPTIFTDIVPSYKLFNSNVLIGAGGFVSKQSSALPQAEGQNLTEFDTVTGIKDVDRPSVALNSKIPLSTQHDFLKSVRDFFNIGSEVFHVDDDLIFKSLDANDEWKNSRPTSVVLENPSSKRLSQISNHRLSQLSLNAPKLNENGELSQHDEEDNDVFAGLNNANLLNSLIKPLNVVLKAGTFEKLVDLLVLTSNVFSKRIDKKDIDSRLESNMLDNQFLKLNMNSGVFTSTFFLTYKSFASTSTLLENLGKRFVGSKSAAISISRLNADNYDSSTVSIFPDWNSQVSSYDSELDWRFVGKIQLGVLEAISILISDYYADFTDNLQNKKIVVDLLKIMDNEFSSEWKNYLAKVQDNTDLKRELTEIYERLVQLYKRIRKNYIKKCYRPLDLFPRNFANESLDSEIILTDLPGEFREAEIFVEKLNWFINDIFSSITISDWVNVFQLLEIQTGKSLTSLFRFKNPNSSGTNEEDLEVMNVFIWIKTLYGNNIEDKILAKFPPPVQLLFEAHFNLEKFFLLQITDPAINRDLRTSRMISILQILSISRLRMSSVDLFSGVSDKVGQEFSPHVPSFIETAIIQAIVSRESRLFVNSWMYSSSTLKGEAIENWDEFTYLLPRFELDDLNKNLKGPLTPCIGWFTERLLEIACYIPNMSNDNSKLINFDKRRFTFNCITNIVDMNTNLENTYNNPTDAQNIKEEFGFLFKLENYSPTEPAEVKEAALKENREYPKNDQKVKLFKGLIDNEMEKIKRDTKKKETLENQERDIKRTQMLSQVRNSASSSRPYVSTATDQVRKARQNISPSKVAGSSVGKRLGGLLRSVRPFSINVGSNWSAPDRLLAPDELPDVLSIDLSGKLSKPIKQVRLFDHKPLYVHSNIDGFFKLVGDNGEETCFQALDNNDAQGWISALNLSKRFSYLSKDSHSLRSSKVFGVPIADVCERDGTLIPRIVERLLQEIELRGLDETGLYRVPGSVGSINALKQAFDEGGDFTLEDDRWFEVNTLAGCFKSYLREVPESLLTNELLPEFIRATKEGDLDENLNSLVHRLPIYNYHLLKRLFEHLNKVIQHSENNRMDATNLAIVFSMSFLNNDNIASSMGSDLGALQTLIQFLIREPTSAFSDVSDSTVFSSSEE